VYLLYLDESGHQDDPKLQHVILGGLAVFERQPHWLSSSIDAIAARFNPAEPHAIELHGSPMLQGRDGWKHFPLADRVQAMRDALDVVAKSHVSTRLFSIAIRKAAPSLPPGTDVQEEAFERLCKAFDIFLMRGYKRGDTHRGIVIVDETSYETTFQRLARNFRMTGHRWGVLRNLAEVPMCLDSKASRLIQLADLIAFACFRHYERGDSRFFDIIKSRFDEVGGVQHGLVHIT